MGSEIMASSSGAIKLMDDETKELRVAAHAGIVKDDSRPVQTFDLPLGALDRARDQAVLDGDALIHSEP